MAVQPGLCGTWWETRKNGFLISRLIFICKVNGLPGTSVEELLAGLRYHFIVPAVVRGCECVRWVYMGTCVCGVCRIKPEQCSVIAFVVSRKGYWFVFDKVRFKSACVDIEVSLRLEILEIGTKEILFFF